MTMTHEDYVSYPLARKLKEAGFDWECRAVWHFDGEEYNFILDYGATFMHPKDIPHWNTSKVWGSHIYSAPTLAQAVKWLREVKDYIIVVYPSTDFSDFNDVMEPFLDGKWFFELWVKANRISLKETASVDYPTYESALSSGISAALEILGKEGQK